MSEAEAPGEGGANKTESDNADNVLKYTFTYSTISRRELFQRAYKGLFSTFGTFAFLHLATIECFGKTATPDDDDIMRKLKETISDGGIISEAAKNARVVRHDKSEDLTLLCGCDNGNVCTCTCSCTCGCKCDGKCTCNCTGKECSCDCNCNCACECQASACVCLCQKGEGNLFDNQTTEIMGVWESDHLSNNEAGVFKDSATSIDKATKKAEDNVYSVSGSTVDTEMRLEINDEVGWSLFTDGDAKSLAADKKDIKTELQAQYVKTSSESVPSEEASQTSGTSVSLWTHLRDILS